jgi:hypothetical protein
MIKSSSEEWKEQKGKIGPPTNSQRQTKMETSAKLGARSIAPREKHFQLAKPCPAHHEFGVRLVYRPIQHRCRNRPKTFKIAHSQTKSNQVNGGDTPKPETQTRNGHSPLFQPVRAGYTLRQPETPNSKPETIPSRNHLPNASAPLDLAALDLKLCI